MVSLISIPIYGNKLDTKALRRVLEDHLLDMVEGMLTDYEATVATWETPVEFEFEVASTENELTAVVGTNNQIYEWVNEGTGQAAGHRGDWYPIPSAPTGVAYQGQFSPKTRPGMLSSRGGGKTGPVNIIRAQVTHPGIEPRQFDETITEKWQERFTLKSQRTLDDFYRSQRQLLTRITRR